MESKGMNENIKAMLLFYFWVQSTLVLFENVDKIIGHDLLHSTQQLEYQYFVDFCGQSVVGFQTWQALS